MFTPSLRYGRKSLLLVTALSTGVLSFGIPGPAAAADAPSQSAQAPAIEEIVVTGTLIVRNGYQAPTPVTVLNSDEIERAGQVNFADYAQKIPTLASSFNSHTSGESTGTGQAGANALNLRGLNANRTLVLLDGVRITPNSATGYYGDGGTIDINAFPDALISRVDVVTGGATASYGSGALAGAVNFILNNNYVGVKGSATGGLTTYGDDPMYAVNLTAGTTFGNGRGHAMVSLSDSWNKGVPSGEKRGWINQFYGRITNPGYTSTNGQPFYLFLPGLLASGYSPGGVITGGPLKGIAFGAGGAPLRFNYGALNDGVEMQGGGPALTGPLQANWGPHSALDLMVARQNLFTRVSYDLTDDINLYAQYMYAHTTASGNSRDNFITATINSGNPFIPASVQAQMTQQGIASFPLGLYSQVGIFNSRNRRHFDQYLAGLKGSFEAFGSKWAFDVFTTYSDTMSSFQAYNVFQKAKFANAVDAVPGPNGTIICRIAVANPATNCVAYNPMGTGVLSQGATDYLLSDHEFGLQDMSLTEIKGTLRGEPFSTWAGPVSVALGAEYQYDKAHGIADPVAIAAGYTTPNYNPVIGAYHTTEGFGEIVIPLAQDVVWAKSLEFNAGGRVTDFSTSGTVTTWKIGATYRPVDDLRLRVTRSRDTRQPTMGELFASAIFTNAAATANNPFRGNAPVIFSGFTAGNSTLAPEKADNTGLGAVYNPSWFSGFTTSFDYYNIKINGAIASLSNQLTINNCFNGVQAFCAGVVRDSANNISSVTVTPSNTAGQMQRGFDIESSYNLPLADISAGWDGSVTARGLLTHVIAQRSIAPDGVVTPNVLPPWRYNVSVSYRNDLWSLGWTGRGTGTAQINGLFTACASGCPASNPPYYTANTNTIPRQFYMDADLAYRLKTDAAEYELFLAVENIANTDPPGIVVVGALANIPNPLGRIFRGGVRFKM